MGSRRMKGILGGKAGRVRGEWVRKGKEGWKW